MKRYFIGSDNSGHKYVVELAHRDEWVAWSELPEDDESGWETPDYAHRLNMSLSFLSFTDPKEEE